MIQEYDIQGLGIGGINKAVAPQIIDDNQWEVATDFLFDRFGFIRQRGPVKRALNTSSSATATLTSGDPLGIAVTRDMGGVYVFFVDNTGGHDLVDTPYTSTASNPAGFPSATTDELFFSYPITLGPWKGTTLKTQASYEIQSGPYFWRGSIKGTYTNGTITVSRGGTAVTGSSTLWAANAEPGMALFAKNNDVTTDYAFVGWVKTVTDNTNIVLEEKSYQAVTGRDYRLVPAEPVYSFERVSKGTITTDTTSTTVSGGFTAFREQMATGTWLIFRKRDLTFVGKVSSITDDDTIVLAANAAIAMSDEEYIALTASTPGVNRQFGVLSTTYAQRQWWGLPESPTAVIPDSGRRIYLSAIDDPFSLFVTDKKGDYVAVPIFGPHKENFLVAVQGTFAGMLIFDSYETNILTGQTIDTFTIQNLWNDGCLNHQTIWEYRGGYLWAGRKGIYWFDGTSVTNLVNDTLGDWYVRTFLDYDHINDRVWAMIHRDHYFVHYETNSLTIIINLLTGSISTSTNLRLRGAVRIPASVGSGTWYVVDDGTKPVICDAENLFDESGLDTITCTGESAGPRIQLESKQFSIGDMMRKKFWKAIGMTYRAVGSNVTITIATGLDGSYAATTATPSSFASSSTYVRKRVKFHKFSEFLRFKLVAATPGSLSQFWISAATLFWKPQRKDRY